MIFRVLSWAKFQGDESIAIKLGLSTQAVEEYRANLIRKTGLLSQAGLGVQLGLIQAS